ncbi:hypothetical protein GTA07_19460 [Rhodococcus hoagii]|nr:hypothetical protein [Prescottella equi]
MAGGWMAVVGLHRKEDASAGAARRRRVTLGGSGTERCAADDARHPVSRSVGVQARILDATVPNGVLTRRTTSATSGSGSTEHPWTRSRGRR